MNRIDPSNRSRAGTSRRRFLAGLAMAGALLAAACGGGGGNGESGSGSSSSPAASSSAEAGAPVKGGSLTYLTFKDFTHSSLDPLSTAITASSGGGDISKMIYGSLLYLDPDRYEMVYDIAESFDTTDNVTWTLKLHPGVVFSDGTPFDAEAVKFNWERHADPEKRSTGGALARSVASYEVVDPTTLKAVLDKPNAQFDWAVARLIAAVGSPTAIKADEKAFGLKPVGAGPFVVKEYRVGDAVDLERNPSYYREGLPNLDAITVRIVTDDQQRYNALTQNEGQVMYTRSLTQANAAESAGYQVLNYTPNGGLNLMFNQTRPPFDDVEARRALALAFDVKSIASIFRQGASMPVESMFLEGTPFYDGKPAQPEFDKVKAQEAFDKLAAAKGGPLTFTIRASNSLADVAEFIVVQLSQFNNVKPELKVHPSTQSESIQQAKDFEILASGWQFDDPNPGLHNAIVTGTSTNFGGYSNPRVDELLMQAAATLDDGERKVLLDEVQEIFRTDVPALFFERVIQLKLVDKSVKGARLSRTDP